MEEASLGLLQKAAAGIADALTRKAIRTLIMINPELPSIPGAFSGALLIPDTVAAAIAGVSRAHWHRLRAAGKLPPAIRLGRKVLWRRLEVADWIANGCPDAGTWAAIAASNARARR